MGLLSINDFGEQGINSDLPAWTLPNGAITSGNNFRVLDGKIGNFGNYEDWATPGGGASSFNPGLALRVLGASDYIILAGRSAVYVFDGTTFTDLSNAAGYSSIGTDQELDWTGCLLGKIPVINNPNAFPEYWDPQSISQVMQDLDWDASNTWRDKVFSCSAMRSHKTFLIAMNLTEGGIDYPDSYRWSHPADANSLPFTWDETVTTNLAGKAALGGDGGAIIDGLSLRDAFALYSENAIDILDYTGDNFVFDRRELSSTIGLLSRRALVEVKGTHFFLGDGDILMNDGNSINSIIHKRLRKRMLANMEADSYLRSFALNNVFRKEVWFCVPEGGASRPNVAYVYNWKDDKWSIKDVPPIAHACYAPRAVPSNTWATIVSTWANVVGVWGSRQRTPADDNIIGIENSPTVVNILDDVDAITATFATRIERTGLKLTDDESINTVNEIYPRIEGDTVVSISIGAQDYPDGPITWGIAQDFDSSSDRKLSVRSTGKLHCWKMESTASAQWWLSGMDFQFVSDGIR